MKRILTLTVASFVLLAMVGVGTWAYFSDTEQSTGNTFTAGTLNLKLANGAGSYTDGVSASLSGSILMPADVVGPATIHLKNTGNTDADHADIGFKVAYTDNSLSAELPGSNVTTASWLKVTAMTFDGTSLLTQGTAHVFDIAALETADANNDDIITLAELSNVILTGFTPPAKNNGIKDFVVTITVDSGAGNGIQGDSVDLTITFGLYADPAANLVTGDLS
jgi:spore coat-associated protein N